MQFLANVPYRSFKPEFSFSTELSQMNLINLSNYIINFTYILS
ncbi:hypothetical protein D930_00396 [Enterococcus faecalis KI-6-1-110608-1]|nr:hypothetical protein D930_00396 [Enterococcus faecalis KI-6-1-110608-1]